MLAAGQVISLYSLQYPPSLYVCLCVLSVYIVCCVCEMWSMLEQNVREPRLDQKWSWFCASSRMRVEMMAICQAISLRSCLFLVYQRHPQHTTHSTQLRPMQTQKHTHICPGTHTNMLRTPFLLMVALTTFKHIVCVHLQEGERAFEHFKSVQSSTGLDKAMQHKDKLLDFDQTRSL